MNKRRKLYGIILLILLTFIGCGTVTEDSINGNPMPSSSSIVNTGSDNGSNDNSNESTLYVNNPEQDTTVDSKVTVHFIDVGQGDATLIECNGKFMLIDAGENNQGEAVSSYLNKLGVEKIDYLIGTHPHSDHIGGLDIVINNFDIGIFIMPEIEHTTQTYEDMLDVVISKDLLVKRPVVGETYQLGDAEFVIIAPNDNYKKDLNSWSVGLKLIYGENSFVFTGDAEITAEYDILENNIDISATVFHAGHHGSDTSNSEGLLKAINPKYIVISCGTGNSYGHPHKEILDRIEEYNIISYRTDLYGTIIATSDGNDITWNIETKSDNETPTSVPTIALTNTLMPISTLTPIPTLEPTNTPTPEPTATLAPTPTLTPEPTEKVSVTVHITKTGEKYHSSGCQYLSKSDISISLDDAKARGYSACSKCNPPR